MKKNKLKILNVLIFWILLSIVAYGVGGIYLSVFVWVFAFGLGLLAKK